MSAGSYFNRRSRSRESLKLGAEGAFALRHLLKPERAVLVGDLDTGARLGRAGQDDPCARGWNRHFIGCGECHPSADDRRSSLAVRLWAAAPGVNAAAVSTRIRTSASRRAAGGLTMNGRLEAQTRSSPVGVGSGDGAVAGFRAEWPG